MLMRDMPSTKPDTRTSPCIGRCEACVHSPHPAEMPVRGRHMVGAAAGIFLLPPAAAALGAAWGGPGAIGQAIGAFIGAGAGIGLAGFGYRWAVRTHLQRNKEAL